MTKETDFSQYKADISGFGNELLQKYPEKPVLNPKSDKIIAQYDAAIAALLAIAPLDIGTSENKRSDARRRIDEYDDGENISAKRFVLLKSSFESGQGLGHHYHQNTGYPEGESQFVEGFRMLSSSGVLFVSQYVQDATGILVPGITTPHEITSGSVLVLGKEQAHTLYLTAGEFQGVQPTTFDVSDLHIAKLHFS